MALWSGGPTTWKWLEGCINSRSVGVRPGVALLAPGHSTICSGLSTGNQISPTRVEPWNFWGQGGTRQGPEQVEKGV